MKTILRLLLLTGTTISLFCSCRMIEPTHIRFRNKHKVVFKMDGKRLTINNIPSGYNRRTMHIIRADGYETFIPYPDFSFLYFFEDGYYYTPNKENIKKMRTVESEWRLRRDFYLDEKKYNHSDSFFQQRVPERCDCTLGDIYFYEQPRVVDLRGREDSLVWRDVMIDDFSMGYILYDTTKVTMFDQCIDTTLRWLEQKQLDMNL